MSKDRYAAQKEAEKHRREIEIYLLAEVRKGKYYFRACDVAEGIGMSAHTVGSNIAQLKTSSARLTIIRWSSSTSTVWKITEKREETEETEETEQTEQTETVVGCS